ncbi:alpha/beta fold hydrolase [Natrarchaeobius chitinivorans]|uniref:Alpha/beta fold hydrolase n=1 Tax=Natrarchaeobius chitinivorans TaxID=1679083 RepID=A0A3N6P6L0_NATCH|nr:alpha/beta hydrolase [Natrarchaeobius chitinivorans]RQG94009.1 alpha/beta fold hydrolase [Natrarchaeobius chitinivorans]
MPRVSGDGASIFYEYDECDGDADGDPVVFLQGLGDGRWMWRWQREAVADAHDVIAPDTRGTGRSDPGLAPVVPRLPGRLRRPLLSGPAGYSVEGLADDLEAVLSDVGTRRVHLVGAGLGGMVAQQYALEYSRAETLTLCSTSHGGIDAVPVPEDVRAQIVGESSGNEREALRNRLRPAFSDRFVNRNPHLIDRIIEWGLEQNADAPARESQLAGVTNFDVSDRLERIRVPTLVLHGTNDRVVPSGNALLLEEAIPDARLELIEGGSHYFFLEESERTNELLNSFLETRLEA